MEVFMAKYGEIALKGNNKRLFEERMIKNIKQRLAAPLPSGARLGDFAYERAQSTLYITPLSETADFSEIERRLLTVFGIGAVQRSLALPKDYKEIVRLGVPYLKRALAGAKTFKVEAKRADKTFPMNSMELMREFGGEIWEANSHLSVDVHNPDVTVFLEIRDSHAYVCPNRLQGAGGIPVGMSGKALVMLSGGIDSPVAAYMMAKRGLSLDMLHFQSPPYTSERALMKVGSLCGKLAEYCGEIRLFTVNLTEAQEDIRDNCPEEYMTILLRRLMFRIAAELCKEGHYSAIVTGESVGQVASQTPAALICTNDASPLPVYRPVIGMDKIEITAIARKIGTFDISTLPYEDCCTVFTPRRPKLKPFLNDVKRLETRLNADLMQKATENIIIENF
ncbi:MAG: tRNA 4-thiouridine(8) synthase ThiI [Oscillospiraceae bacterium]|jgi:thiamine biosynthesis protein ThiI|nr:tRNA 4-thiouridine(8) synthase ThiI [Oscillospiraceae bacterium]